MSSTLAGAIVLGLYAIFVAPLVIAYFWPNTTRWALPLFGFLFVAALGSHFAWSFGMIG